MRTRSDERAQSTLVGAILLFAILIIAFSSYQAFVVPNQNAEVEFNHNGDVQTDMQELRNSLLDVRSVENGRIVSEHRPVSIRLGTQFPERLIALNPPSPSGTLETEAAESEFRIENATVQGSFDGNPGTELLNSSPNASLRTNFLVYRPEYTEYREPPETVLEHSLLYNDFGDANVTIGEQTVIRPDSNRIDIVLYDGNVSRSGSQAVTLDPETLDGPTATVPIESAGGDITVQIPTRNPGVWTDAVAELNGVVIESRTDSSVTVSLTENEYTLRVTRVGFDGGEAGGPLSDIQPRGAAAAGGNTTFDTFWSSDSASGTADDPYIVDPDETVTLTATVQGRESGLPIDTQPTTFTYAYDVVNDGAYSFGQEVRNTGANGMATTDFTVPSSTEAEPGDQFEAYVSAGDDGDVAVFEVSAAGGGGGTMADRTQLSSSNGFGNPPYEIRFTLDNTGGGDSIITDIRFDSTDSNADYINNPSGDTFRTDGGNTLFAGRIDLNSQENINQLTIGDGNSVTLELGQFRRSNNNNRVNMNNNQATITLTFDDNSQESYVITG